ncbi:hypothetical protein KIH27_21375 [Mycobacterium sp. M1]|uniref:Uncharacterized protein n=1 Tax=Mycolicibacter acidiphilus TaxID=2835306 RepID=A0ABS5RRF3_9MYCO|nr:hypothetical protein [Mycolicibacter acidiphilus]
MSLSMLVTHLVWEGAVSVADERGAGPFLDGEVVDSVVAASAVSARRSVLVNVARQGYVSGVRLLNPAVGSWDSATLNEYLCRVAGVAHDRYVAMRRAETDRAGGEAELMSVAEQERRLDF